MSRRNWNNTRLHLNLMRAASLVAGDLHKGDRVILNYEKIAGRKDYSRYNPLYCKFVEDNRGVQFTVACDSKSNKVPGTVEFCEDPSGWLFWVGDLIKVDD